MERSNHGKELLGLPFVVSEKRLPAGPVEKVDRKLPAYPRYLRKPS